MKDTFYDRLQVGTQGLENGEKFVDICGLNKLVVRGSIFPHKKIHKATWVSIDHITENQIDHICINKKFRKSLQDERVKRQADVASDHQFLTARLKLKLQKNRRGKKKFNKKLSNQF